MTTVLVIWMACSTKPGAASAPETPVPAPEAPVKAVPAPAPAEEPAADPQALYAACEARVEQPQAAGECTKDTDCAKAGCSSEVCTTTTMAEQMMTGCDYQPCFAVLESCGCHDGACTWTVADSAE